MAIREVLTYPDPRLKQVAPETSPRNPYLAVLFADLVDTLRSHRGGVGLAAPQLGEAFRAVVVDVSGSSRPGSQHGLLRLVNPKVTAASQWKKGREGCMSLPWLLGNIKRAQKIRLQATDEAGASVDLECEGYEAVAIQHEIDHLDGILFPDRVKSSHDLLERRETTGPSEKISEGALPPEEAVQALFFDLDGTLLDDLGAIREAWEKFQTRWNERGVRGDWDRLRRAYERHAYEQWALGEKPDRYDPPEMILEKAWAHTLEEEPREGFPPPGDLARDFLELLESSWHFYEDAPGVLDQLRGRYRLAVVTNGGNDFQHRKYDQLGLNRWFDAVFVAEECLAAKPDPEIFLFSCRHLGMDPSRCLMVGDNLKRDVEGALGAGLSACWIDRFGGQAPAVLSPGTQRITTLRALKTVLFSAIESKNI